MKLSFPEIEKAVRARMKEKAMHDDVTHEFLRRVKLVHEGYKGKIPWKEIGDLHTSDYARLEDLPDVKNPADILSKLCVIKLNGGLGTTMGLDRAKSLIPVKDGMSFLQIITGQIMRLREKYKVSVPLLFMNSFNTREDTLKEPGVASLNEGLGLPADFLQNMVPRIHADSLLPAGDGRSSSDWCPPGHGDIFPALKITGILDTLIQKGYRVLFISNGDNLGATVESRILAYFLENNLEFVMEATPKTKADLKGGVLYRRLDEAGRPGRMELLETAQVEDEHLPDFYDVRRFQYFSINNLWVNLEALREKLKTGLPLSVIVNPKTVSGTPILQLEAAMGAGVGHFDRTRVVVVPRERFAPVKNCADLLVRRSDAYTLRKDDYALVRTHPDAPEPVVLLDDNYKKVQDFDRAFVQIPSLHGVQEWNVKGRFLFDSRVEIKGRVNFTNKSDLPASMKTLGHAEFSNMSIDL